MKKNITVDTLQKLMYSALSIRGVENNAADFMRQN